MTVHFQMTTDEALSSQFKEITSLAHAPMRDHDLQDQILQTLSCVALVLLLIHLGQWFNASKLQLPRMTIYHYIGTGLVKRYCLH